MAHPVDAVDTLAAVLTEHGPLDEKTIEQKLRDAGVADPQTVVLDLLENYRCPAGELPDGHGPGCRRC